MLRVVLDTNIFLSSLLVKVGAPAQIVDAWRGRYYVLVTSPAIIADDIPLDDIIDRTMQLARHRMAV